MLAATFTDGLMVVKDGRVLYEYYGGLMKPTDTHLLMSVSKSLTSALAGALVGAAHRPRRARARLPHQPPRHVVGGLHGPALARHARRYALDEDDYDNPDSDGRLIEQVSGYTSRMRDDIPSDTYQWIAQLPNDGPHGGRFKYRSILPDALAWVIERSDGTDLPRALLRTHLVAVRRPRRRHHRRPRRLSGRRGRHLQHARRPRPVRCDVSPNGQ